MHFSLSSNEVISLFFSNLSFGIGLPLPATAAMAKTNRLLVDLNYLVVSNIDKCRYFTADIVDKTNDKKV